MGGAGLPGDPSHRQASSAIESSQPCGLEKQDEVHLGWRNRMKCTSADEWSALWARCAVVISQGVSKATRCLSSSYLSSSYLSSSYLTSSYLSSSHLSSSYLSSSYLSSSYLSSSYLSSSSLRAISPAFQAGPEGMKGLSISLSRRPSKAQKYEGTAM